MRGAILAAALSVTTVPMLQGQKPSRDLSCVTSLELPTRGLLAAAGESGVVNAVIQIGTDGRLSHLELIGGNRLLRGEVRVAMNLSKFAAGCDGRTIEFVFAFTIASPPADSIRPPGVRFLPPNRFELVFQRVKPIYDLAPSGNPPTSK